MKNSVINTWRLPPLRSNHVRRVLFQLQIALMNSNGNGTLLISSFLLCFLPSSFKDFRMRIFAMCCFENGEKKYSKISLMYFGIIYSENFFFFAINEIEIMIFFFLLFILLALNSAHKSKQKNTFSFQISYDFPCMRNSV